MESLKLGRELVVCYKSIFINTFCIMVIRLGSENLGQFGGYVVFRHESFHIWETQIKGYLLENNDMIILSKDGASLVGLSRSGETKKVANMRKCCG